MAKLDRQYYEYCKDWVRGGKGTPDQLARYAAYIAAFESQPVNDPQKTQHNLFDTTPVADTQPVNSPDGVNQTLDVDINIQAAIFPETVKIWPMVGLAAINANHGGAWRVWVLCHSLDQEGGGRALRSDLAAWLIDLGVRGRQRRRWVHDAIILGLLRESGDHYYLSGLARAALILGCNQLGSPVIVSAETLVRQGWRALVWGAYIATLHGRPISQETKYRITGVDPRTQRNYQAAIPGVARRNYAKTNTPGDHVTGIRDTGRSAAFVGRDGKIVYRLPDIRTVSSGVARLTHKGRSRKAQKIINHSSSEGRVQGHFMRLFHDTTNGVKATLRKLSRADLPPWETPGELFELSRAGRSVNLWQPVAVGGITP